MTGAGLPRFARNDGQFAQRYIPFRHREELATWRSSWGLDHVMAMEMPHLLECHASLAMTEAGLPRFACNDG